MEKQVIFRAYQEQQYADHMGIQEYATTSLEHLVGDAVTATRRFAGFNTQKTAQTEVQVAPGRFYDIDGAVYFAPTTLVQSMVSYLAPTSKRIVTLTAYGTEVETDTETRDYLVDVETGRTEPKAVTTTKSRDAVLSFVVGTDSADPQRPSIPSTSVAVADILVDTTQVVSVTMLTDNLVTSTEDLDERVDDIEEFDDIIGPRVSSLASDLAALANLVKTKSTGFDVAQLYEDMARVKERVEIPAAAVDYGADRFLDWTDSDTDNTQSLGYDAMVQEGCRFAFANEDVFEPDIFSANDPNASLNSGLLLPAFDDVLKMEIGPYHESLGIAQFGFKTHDIVQKTIARQRIRYGEWFQVCSNASFWRGGTYDPVTGTFQKNGETFEVVGPGPTPGAAAGGTAPMAVKSRVRQFWVDSYTESYWEHIVIEHTISGAQVAQSFLVSNDMWLTRVGFYLTSKAANEAVYLTVCELIAGVPNLSKAILQQQVPHTALFENSWTETAVQPTFLQSGKRYALVLTSNANHQIGMAYGQQYLDGSFFTSTDSVYYLGDLQKDMMLRLYGAKFRAPQVTIELTALNLDGGIRDIDFLAGIISPQSTELVFEVQPGGSGAWIALNEQDLSAFSSSPVLARFRARFVGTRDMHAGLMLTGSQVTLFRPKVAFKHVSEIQTLSGPSSEIYVKVLLENYTEAAHDLDCKLYYGAADHDDVLTTDVVIDADAGRIERTFKFTPSEISSFTIELIGASNSASDVFHCAERVHWAL